MSTWLEINKLDVKGLIQRALYWQWKHSGALADGYSIIMPTPEDMPFLSRLTLEGLKYINTDNCGQFLIVGDGHSVDGGKLLAETVAQLHDSRIV